MFPLANASLPRSSFLCHLTERLVSFSVRVFAQMWAPRTLWHAWGLPMRLDGDSDTAARPNDLQNRRRGLEKGCSQPYTWLTEALFALLSCYSALLFVFAEISGLLVSNSDHEIWRADFISSILFIFFVKYTQRQIRQCKWQENKQPCNTFVTHRLADMIKNSGETLSLLKKDPVVCIKEAKNVGFIGS